MLDLAADPDGGLWLRHESKWEIRRAQVSPSLLNMRRLTARLLLLVLFAGPLVPFAAAASAPEQHEHCARMPLHARAESTPSCHNHVAASTHEAVPPAPASRDSLRSNPCCAGHECCRPLARALWAQVSLRAPCRQPGRITGRIYAFQPHLRTVEFANYHSVRGPPAL
jgi:hypothetical protein